MSMRSRRSGLLVVTALCCALACLCLWNATAQEKVPDATPGAAASTPAKPAPPTAAVAKSAAAKPTPAGPMAPDPNAVITLSCVDRPLGDILKYMSEKTGYAFEMESDDLTARPVTLTEENVHYADVLDHIAEGAQVTFEQSTTSKYTVYKQVMLSELVFTKTTVASAIQMIADKSGWNIAIPDELYSRSVPPYRWKNISAMKAMEQILKPAGYIAVREKNKFVRITTPAAERLEMRVATIPLAYVDTMSQRYAGTISVKYMSTTPQPGSTPPRSSNLLEILDRVKSQSGTIDYHQDTNKLIVFDTTAKIEEIRKLVKELDEKPQQLLIDIKIISVDMGDLKQRGFDWNVGAQGSMASMDKILFPFNYGKSWESGMYKKTYPDGGASANETFGYKYGTLDFSQTTMAMKFLDTFSSTRIEQAPLILAMNHQPATIFVGRNIRWAQATLQNQDGVSVRVYSEATGSPIEEGVQILVVPHITGREGDIILTIVPDISELTEWFVIGRGTNSELQLPILSKKTVVTRMIIKDGHTGVIAGLIRDQKSKNKTGVPGLSKIPLLGKLFQYNTKDNRRSNLMIFVTPKIVESGGDNEMQGRASQELDALSKISAELENQDKHRPGTLKEKEEKKAPASTNIKQPTPKADEKSGR